MDASTAHALYVPEPSLPIDKLMHIVARGFQHPHQQHGAPGFGPAVSLVHGLAAAAAAQPVPHCDAEQIEMTLLVCRVALGSTKCETADSCSAATAGARPSGMKRNGSGSSSSSSSIASVSPVLTARGGNSVSGSMTNAGVGGYLQQHERVLDVFEPSAVLPEYILRVSCSLAELQVKDKLAATCLGKEANRRSSTASVTLTDVHDCVAREGLQTEPLLHDCVHALRGWLLHPAAAQGGGVNEVCLTAALQARCHALLARVTSAGGRPQLGTTVNAGSLQMLKVGRREVCVYARTCVCVCVCV
jgi:hypothetical protein